MNLHNMHWDSEYPTAVFCIIATEFCERFSFCGLRTILSLYLRNILLFSENTATVVYHIFIMVSYVVPLIGAILADSFFGRYRTIRNFALIYLVGNIVMCIAAVPAIGSSVALSAIGLTLIAVGTGGIKPCVAAFGAEQFDLPDQRDLLVHFFSIFYFTINLGGFVGMILTPIMRKTVSCFGEDTCYAVGFGFPAVLMILSIFLFIIGRNFYKLKVPKRNVILQFIKCGSVDDLKTHTPQNLESGNIRKDLPYFKNFKRGTCYKDFPTFLTVEFILGFLLFLGFLNYLNQYALARRSRTKKRYDHWLDHARGKFNCKLINEMKIMCSILLLYTPLPIFWSLFDQQGSRWTFQASHMDGNVLGAQVVPDQMQVVNPAMVLLLIPVFDWVLYPCFSKMKVLVNSLHRMAFGGVVAGLAFFSAGILELVLETTYPDLPQRGHASVNVINTLTCDLDLMNPFNGKQIIKSGDIFRFKDIGCHNYSTYQFSVEAPHRCGDVYFKRHTFTLNIVCVEFQVDTVLIGINERDQIEAYVTDPVDFMKSLTGTPRIRIAYIKSSKLLHNVTVALKSNTGFQDIYYVHDMIQMKLAVSAYLEIPQGIYECVISSNEQQRLVETYMHFALGGVYSLIIREEKRSIGFLKLYTMSVPNTVNILWQIPQYFLISVAELMFGIAGLEFSFTQAPRSMKTVTIAAWYLSVAIGNFLVIIITQLNMFQSQAHEFFLFAVFIVADMMVFMEMASHYKFVQMAESNTSTSYIQTEEFSSITEDSSDAEEASMGREIEN